MQLTNDINDTVVLVNIYVNILYLNIYTLSLYYVYIYIFYSILFIQLIQDPYVFDCLELNAAKTQLLRCGIRLGIGNNFRFRQVPWVAFAWVR